MRETRVFPNGPQLSMLSGKETQEGKESERKGGRKEDANGAGAPKLLTVSFGCFGYAKWRGCGGRARQAEVE